MLVKYEFRFTFGSETMSTLTSPGGPVDGSMFAQFPHFPSFQNSMSEPRLKLLCVKVICQLFQCSSTSTCYPTGWGPTAWMWVKSLPSLIYARDGIFMCTPRHTGDWRDAATSYSAALWCVQIPRRHLFLTMTWSALNSIWIFPLSWMGVLCICVAD